MKKKEIKQAYLAYNLVIQFFLETAISLFLGYFLGKKLDQWLFEDTDLFVFVLMILGVLGAIISLAKRAYRLIGDDEKNGKETKSH